MANWLERGLKGALDAPG